ncbi:MAG: hypothetical protein V3W19_04170 [Desulfatiglandales bacterium]
MIKDIYCGLENHILRGWILWLKAAEYWRSLWWDLAGKSSPVKSISGASLISVKRCQVSAPPLAFGAANLIEKDTFVLKFHTRVGGWRQKIISVRLEVGCSKRNERQV